MAIFNAYFKKKRRNYHLRRGHFEYARALTVKIRTLLLRRKKKHDNEL